MCLMTINMYLNNQEVLVSTKIRRIRKTQQSNKSANNLINSKDPLLMKMPEKLPIKMSEKLPIKMSEKTLNIRKIQ
jgi:hypothetical protein